MPLFFINQDITKMHVDIVVNAAKNSLLGGGGVDGAIHAAAGPKLLEECRTLGGCETGAAKLTGGYNMPCKYIIHTVGPVYRDGRHGEPELLRSCYKESLKLALETDCESIAFPAISTGVYGYPKEEAKLIAVAAVKEFLAEHDMTVYLVFFDMPAGDAELARYLMYHRSSGAKIEARESCELEDTAENAEAACNLADTAEYAVEAMPQSPVPNSPKPQVAEPRVLFGKRKEKACAQMSEAAAEATYQNSSAGFTLQEKAPDFRSMLDESFSEMLLRKIDESGMSDSDCYKRANIDRKLFSKIRADRLYKPSKPTAIAFALALRLSEGETEELLGKAGFALSGSSLFDVIIRFYIERGVYDVLKINEELFRYDQTLLGA
ncbi:MAG: O-acetyl-ADP-ribose deacetylase [Lachnospiraceae bacterium]|nr:O-acetyl-ADP-ribose deacetylase [Lachnospiraceae bacterium]